MREAGLIVSADDLGLTEGHNQAIVEAHTRGILTSASLLTGGPAFDDAVERVRSLPGLGIGVHLTLLEGRPVLPAGAVPDLVDASGAFGLSWGRLFARLAAGRVRIEQVRREWRAQIERALVTGLNVTHLDSHKHIHMHPILLGVALALAAEFGLRRMRLTRPVRLTAGAKPAVLGVLAVWARRRAQWRGVWSPEGLLGLEASGRMTRARVLAALDRPWSGTRELMMHPAYPSLVLDRLLAGGYDWIAEYQFEEELATLQDEGVRARLEELQVRLVNYGASEAI
ncbi:MAG TPA: ChbG/HpnK family deacetylase [Chloroflexi bacterium]|nr:ChbG/HpnK family deacetylase [Chloroflexota bacterium]